MGELLVDVNFQGVGIVPKGTIVSIHSILGDYCYVYFNKTLSDPILFDIKHLKILE